MATEQKIVVLVSQLFPEGECTRFRAPDYTLLGFHPTAAQAFLDFVPDDTLVLDLDQDGAGRQFVRDMVMGTLQANQMLELLM
jgi:hypothetical protein